VSRPDEEYRGAERVVFLDIRLVSDPEVPIDEIHVRDEDGTLLQRIVKQGSQP
jgi:hypothetical protein